MAMIDEINQTAAAAGVTPGDLAEISEMQEAVNRPRFDFSKLTAETGEGSVEEYQTHPMNWDGSKEAARVIRGLTGIAGKLNLAIVDILIGWFGIQKKMREKNARIRDDENIPYKGAMGN